MIRDLPSRRSFLKGSGALPVMGAITPLALQLAAFTQAAGATGTPDYKALVCIYQAGGNDSNNTVLATDSDSWGRYFATRNIGTDPIALMPVGTAPVAVGSVSPVTGRTVTSLAQPEAWGGVLPITPLTRQAYPAGTTQVGGADRTFAFHPMMAPLVPLFNQKRLAVLANVGTLIGPTTKDQIKASTAVLPLSLFSHNDQTYTWQAGVPEGGRTGWGGLFGDTVQVQNGSNALLTGIAPTSSPVFLAGKTTIGYQVTTASNPAIATNPVKAANLFGSTTAQTALSEIMTDTTQIADMGSDYATITARSFSMVDVVNGAMTLPAVQAIPANPAYTHPITGTVTANPLADQLRTVARLIAAAPSLGVKRQVFFVSFGTHDSHDGQNTMQPDNLSKLALAMAAFDTTLSSLGGVDMRSAVTTFTASEFSRTFATNGDGTDHAWGGHHLIMGGAVHGGDIYGHYPTLGLDTATFNNPDMYGANGVMIPTTSVDQYGATLGRWFGVSDADLNTIFPNLKNFATPVLGFL